MTAFARSTADLDAYQAVWELRTVNHRYLEINPRLSEGYRHLEPTVREQARALLQRGKLDATLRVTEAGNGANALQLDPEMARAVTELGTEAQHEFGTAGPLTTVDLLQWPGVVRARALEAEEAQRRLTEALETAFRDLVTAREREGESLDAMLRERLRGVEEGIAHIRERLPQVRQGFRDRLEERLGELRERVDPDRLEQELVMFLQRSDVDEEMDRLTTHVAEVRRTLDEGGTVGRRLDFLMQEMNREANTIGSKSPDAAISQAVVDLKVLIEQMREQAQNIE
jgi:uncharacterized protein (TIGR00255 family)